MICSVETSAAGLINALYQERGFSDLCRRDYLYHWAGLAKWCGSSSVDVSDEMCGRYLSWLESRGKSAKYCHSIRASLMAVRNAAADRGLCERPKIRLVRVPESRPVAWSREEVSSLVAAAGTLNGRYASRRRAEWWQSAIRGAWHTGLRRGDQLGLERCQFDCQGLADVVQHKTGKLVPVRLPVDLPESLPQTGRLWPWPYSYENFRLTFRRIVQVSAVRAGSWKRLRKSAGTAAEELAPGRGHLLLGHERRTFEAAYWDRGREPPVALPPV